MFKPKIKVTKPKVRVQLAKCGRCGKPYSNPLSHTCKIGFNKTGQRRVARGQGKR